LAPAKKLPETAGSGTGAAALAGAAEQVALGLAAALPVVGACAVEPLLALLART
jgi:hypothetical protein